MSVARDFATFLTRVSYNDIPPLALEHAAMLISSTVASGAWGSGIAYSPRIVFAPKGAGTLVIDWADVDAKYRTLVPRAQVSDQQVEASLQVIHHFGTVKHVSELIDLLQT